MKSFCLRSQYISLLNIRYQLTSENTWSKERSFFSLFFLLFSSRGHLININRNYAQKKPLTLMENMHRKSPRFVFGLLRSLCIAASYAAPCWSGQCAVSVSALAGCPTGPGPHTLQVSGSRAQESPLESAQTPMPPSSHNPTPHPV